MMPTGSEPLLQGRGRWQYPAEMQSQRVDLRPYLYRARSLGERFFNKIKHYRRIATRYDKLAANYLASVRLASIRLRINESAS
jgi:transposase